MPMVFMGIFPGSAQSLISGNAQYHRLFNLHHGGAMLLHLTSPRRRYHHEADQINEHIRSVEDCRNLVGAIGVGSRVWQQVMYTVAPLWVT
jgi:hypothetical protein